MANVSKWDQAAIAQMPRGGGAGSPKTPKYGAQNLQSPFGSGSPFVNVQPPVSSSPSSETGATSLSQAIQAPFVMKPGSMQMMGPYVAGGRVPDPAPSAWRGGALGAVPNHHGWGGLKQNTKDWTLRILGAFPGLRFSSGFRTPAQNAAAGGVPNSGHMRGDKIDLSGPTKQLYQAAAWAKSHGAKVLLHNAGSGFHLDISWAGVNA